jgi:ribosomal protein S18 acetylase RimI-like enzyme
MNIPEVLTVSREFSEEDKQFLFQNLSAYNVQVTHGLLRKPGIDFGLALKNDQGQVFGGIFCYTFLYCLYIDDLWIDERCRGMGYGKALLVEAERIARELGCSFAHTSTCSYQAPDFYQRNGYKVFGILDDYPEGIIQYFLKKKL